MAKSAQAGGRLRVVLAEEIGFGPGKAALLEGIRETGSIAAAGRRIGMSYKRAWLLVSAMNEHFEGPLISAVKGGRAGGGARLTPLGEDVLGIYQEMQQRSDRAIAPLLRRLTRMTRQKPAPPPKP